MRNYFKRRRTWLYLTLGVVLLLVVGTSLVVTQRLFENRDSYISPADLPVSFDELTDAQRIVRDRLLPLLKPGAPDSIFAVFDAIQNDSELRYNCHAIGHSLGRRAYEMYGFSDAMTFDNPLRTQHTSIEEICGGGYMHGILEETLAHKPELKNNPAQLCANVPAPSQWNCYHGVGHALMFIYKRNLNESLTGCRILGPTSDKYCFEGVWMELFFSNMEHSGPNTLNWDIDNPLASCANTQEDNRHECLFYVTLGYLQIHPANYKGAIQLCTKSGLSDIDAGVCLVGLGTKLMPYLGGRHLDKSEEYSVGLTEEQKSFFYAGLFNYAVVAGVSKEELTTECAMLKTDSAVCLRAVASQIAPN